MRRFNTPAGEVHSLRFTPDGRSIYFVSAETWITPESIGRLPQHAYRIDIDSGEVTGDWSFKASEIAMFTPDLQSLYHWPTHEPYAWPDDERFLHRLDLRSNKGHRIYGFEDVDARPPVRCAFTPDGCILAMVEDRRDGSDVIHRLNVLDMTELEEIQTDAVCLAYSFDGGLLATSGPAGVRVWSEHASVDQWPEPAFVLAWSRDGRLGWASDRRFVVARPGTREADHSWGTGGDRLSALALSPDGRWLLGATGSGMCIFHDSLVGMRSTVFEWGIGPIHSVAFSPDGLTCAAGGENGQVVVWDVDL